MDGLDYRAVRPWAFPDSKRYSHAGLVAVLLGWSCRLNGSTMLGVPTVRRSLPSEPSATYPAVRAAPSNLWWRAAAFAATPFIRGR